MKRLKDFRSLYRIYRQVNPPITALRLAWMLSGE